MCIFQLVDGKCVAHQLIIKRVPYNNTSKGNIKFGIACFYNEEYEDCFYVHCYIRLYESNEVNAKRVMRKVAALIWLRLKSKILV